MKQNVVVSEAVSAEVQNILMGMQGISKEKLGKMVVKSFGHDKKLNAFLNADFSRGLSLFTDKKRREKLFEAVEAYGITDVTRKRATLIAMMQADVDQQVKEKIAEVTLSGALPLSDEQKKALESKTIEYRSFLEKNLQAGIVELGLYVGAWEIVKEEEKEVPALKLV